MTTKKAEGQAPKPENGTPLVQPVDELIAAAKEQVPKAKKKGSDA